MRIPLAIVGNGGAAAEAVMALRAHGYRGDIHLFADNVRPPYNPMLGTYLISGAIPLERAFPFGDERAFYGSHRVAAHLGTAVTGLDAAGRTLSLADGSIYDYDRCLVATGSRPTVPPVPGLAEAVAGRRRIFTLRSLDDALALKEAIGGLRGGAAVPRIAVLGASFVGLKVAEVFHGLSIGVCLVEREEHILPRSAHPVCARLLEQHLLEQGHELRLGANVEAVEVGSTGVRLIFDKSPGPEDFDLVVVCTGIRPALDFLTPGQLLTGPGIIVDEQMRSSIPSLYAAGDVAQGPNLLTGRNEIIALWAGARYQGRAAGRSLAGAPGGYRGSVPSSISHVGKLLFASVGDLHDCDRVTTDGQAGAFRLQAWRGESLVGVNLVDCCLSAGAMRQVLMKAATGFATTREATWISFNG